MSIRSPQAVTRLWDEHRNALVLYARQWCDGPEDVVQEAFLLLVRQGVAPEDSVGWLYRIVRNNR
jgi:RNA polymerase sigma-70 factor (ECF subfamily)